MRSFHCRLEEVTKKHVQMIRGFMADCCEGKRLADNRGMEGKEGWEFDPQTQAQGPYKEENKRKVKKSSLGDKSAFRISADKSETNTVHDRRKRECSITPHFILYTYFSFSMKMCLKHLDSKELHQPARFPTK